MKRSILSTLVLIPSLVLAQGKSIKKEVSEKSQSPAFEALCRVKAKEVANQAFRACLNENKSTEIEKIRKDYADKLAKMKQDYEQELTKISGKKTADKTTSDSPVTKPTMAEPTETTSPEPSTESENKKEAYNDTFAAERIFMNNAILNASIEDLTVKTSGPTPSKAKRVATIALNQPDSSDLATVQVLPRQGAKAILFEEGGDIPEPIPVESFSSGPRH